MYYIIEIQKMNDGSFGHLVHTAETRRHAESKYHEILSYAALSNLLRHTVVLMGIDGSVYAKTSYTSQPAIEADE